MAFLQDWLRRPQRVWLRRAFFQIHLWTGIGAGLYIFAVCVSGSAVVFRVELGRHFNRGPEIVAVSGPRLSDADLSKIAEQDHPGYKVSDVWPSKKPTHAVEIWLKHPGASLPLQREFDPYTGKDLGNKRPFSLDALEWLIDFHGTLGFGPTGRTINGIGGFFVTLLCLTGMAIWWPGVSNWRRSIMFAWRGDWKRFNWELHSTVGFWMLLVVFMFAITGSYVVFTEPFERVINAVSPLRVYRLEIADDAAVKNHGAGQGPALGKPKIDPDTFDLIDAPGREPQPTFGDQLVRWGPRLHYGRFAGIPGKTLWVILGLAPPLLFCTGAIMWWNRVLRPEARRARRKARLAARNRAVEIPEMAPNFGSSSTP